MIESNNDHMFLEFGLSHSKILDCLELLRTEEMENFLKILLWTANGTETRTVVTLFASGSVGEMLLQ